jgi:protein disulfide-isomerase A6
MFAAQVVNEKVLKEACEEKPLCVVSVLPNILDCQADCRNGYLDTLKVMGDKYRKKMWG